MSIVLFSPKLVPVHTSSTTCFPHVAECTHHSSAVQISWHVDISVCARKRHGDVVVVVEHSLVSIAPLRSAGCSPCAIVACYPITMLVVMACTCLFRTPIHLCDNDWLVADNRNRSLE